MTEDRPKLSIRARDSVECPRCREIIEVAEKALEATLVCHRCQHRWGYQSPMVKIFRSQAEQLYEDALERNRRMRYQGPTEVARAIAVFLYEFLKVYREAQIEVIYDDLVEEWRMLEVGGPLLDSN